MEWDDEYLDDPGATPGIPERTARCRHRREDPPYEADNTPYWATGDADQMLAAGGGEPMGDQGVAMMGKVAIIIVALTVVAFMVQAY